MLAKNIAILNEQSEIKKAVDNLGKKRMDNRCEITQQNLRMCVDEIIYLIEEAKRELKNRELISLCRKYVGKIEDGVNPHLYHELAEASLNAIIKRKYAKQLLMSINPAREVSEIIKPLAARFPTQTWRSREQTLLQQFSTPPAIAYLLSYLLNYQKGEHVLEPSAGTGNLIIWASALNMPTHTNEIDSRRRELLRLLGCAPTAYNGEFIHDYLPPDIEPDCLVMNPPFSSSGGRTALNSSKYGFRHVESALERLKSGGKFGIILGEAGGLDTKTGNDFWRKLSDHIKIKAIIKLCGREYYKNGTTVDVNLIIGEKLYESQIIDWLKTISQITCISAQTVEEALEKTQKLNLPLNR